MKFGDALSSISSNIPSAPPLPGTPTSVYIGVLTDAHWCNFLNWFFLFFSILAFKIENTKNPFVSLSLIFSPIMFNLPLIPSSVFFHLRHCSFYLYSSACIFVISYMSLLNFWNMGNIVTLVLMTLSANSNTNVSSGSVSND